MPFGSRAQTDEAARTGSLRSPETIDHVRTARWRKCDELRKRFRVARRALVKEGIEAVSFVVSPCTVAHDPSGTRRHCADDGLGRYTVDVDDVTDHIARARYATNSS